ncbi:unnamed protein product [Brassicogethes aeneus]|uniref:RNA helicase n=1 Tax=Brassicogethes aeneus TaxID=1431903 RepID=A0A9P0FNW9_BRAAE|nr:unnamed protein product [Brassicogethes aeneus]
MNRRRPVNNSDFKKHLDYVKFLMQNAQIINCFIDRDEAEEHYKTFIGVETVDRNQFNDFLKRLLYSKIILNNKNKKKIKLSHTLMLNISFERVTDERKIEARYTSNVSCKLCKKTYTNNNFLQHKSTVHHKARVAYLSTDTAENTMLKLCDGDYNLLRKVTFAGNNLNVNCHLVNTSGNSCKILHIFSLNVYQNINVQVGLPVVLGSNEYVKLKVIANFRGRININPVIAVVFEENGVVQYDFKKINVSDHTEVIIPGIPLPENSNFVAVNKLLAYRVPGNFLTILNKFVMASPTPRLGLTQEIYINAANYDKLSHYLLYAEEDQMKIDMKVYNTKSHLELLHGSFYRLQVPGLAESRPSLIRGDSVLVRETEFSKIKFEGIVHRVEQASVQLGFDGKIKPFAMRNQKFYVEFGFNRYNFKVQHTACQLAKDHNFVDYLFPTFNTFQYSDFEPNYFDRNLNDKQRAAVRNVINCPVNSQPYLIFGPPGTGKTSTVIELIRQIHKSDEQARILVCGPSNSSVDEIASRLIDNIPKSEMLRFVALSYSRSLKDSKIADIINKNHDGCYIPTIEQLQKYKIVLTTNANAGRFYSGDVKSDHFTYVIIDEAGYLTEAETLIPLAGVLTNKLHSGAVHGKLVLAGDPRQLGPRVHSKTALKYGFGVSLLERLIDSCEVYRPKDNVYDEKYVTFLEMNYRSHPAILHVPNELFYHGKLIAAEVNFSMLFNDWEHLKRPGFPILFHNVHGVDTRDANSPSFYNPEEVKVVIEYVEKLLATRVSGVQVKQEHIGIITPYRKQIEVLQGEMKNKNWSKVTVGSVEQFQGKENMVIIVSAVRSKRELIEFDEKFDLGFLSNPKRFNVAVTRAKSLVILVGNGDILQYDRCWRKYIEYCIENNSKIGPDVLFTEDTGEE